MDARRLQIAAFALIAPQMLMGDMCYTSRAPCAPSSVTIPAGGVAVARITCDGLDKKNAVDFQAASSLHIKARSQAFFNPQYPTDLGYFVVLTATPDASSTTLPFDIYFDTGRGTFRGSSSLTVTVVHQSKAQPFGLTANPSEIDRGQRVLVTATSSSSAGPVTFAWLGEGFSAGVSAPRFLDESGIAVQPPLREAVGENGLKTNDWPRASRTYSALVWDGSSHYLIETPVAVNGTTPLKVDVVDLTETHPIHPGDSISLKATASGGLGPYEYTWTPGHAVFDTLNAVLVETTTFTIAATDSVGSRATTQITVEVVPPDAGIPDAGLASDSGEAAGDGGAGPDGSIAPDGGEQFYSLPVDRSADGQPPSTPIQLSVEMAGLPEQTRAMWYQGSDVDGELLATDTPTITVTPLTTTTYTVLGVSVARGVPIARGETVVHVEAHVGFPVEIVGPSPMPTTHEEYFRMTGQQPSGGGVPLVACDWTIQHEEDSPIRIHQDGTCQITANIPSGNYTTPVGGTWSYTLIGTRTDGQQSAAAQATVMLQ